MRGAKPSKTGVKSRHLVLIDRCIQYKSNTQNMQVQPEGQYYGWGYINSMSGVSFFFLNKNQECHVSKPKSSNRRLSANFLKCMQKLSLASTVLYDWYWYYGNKIRRIVHAERGASIIMHFEIYASQRTYCSKRCIVYVVMWLFSSVCR